MATKEECREFWDQYEQKLVDAWTGSGYTCTAEIWRNRPDGTRQRVLHQEMETDYTLMLAIQAGLTRIGVDVNRKMREALDCDETAKTLAQTMIQE